jgi:hypothetical protein
MQHAFSSKWDEDCNESTIFRADVILYARSRAFHSKMLPAGQKLTLDSVHKFLRINDLYKSVPVCSDIRRLRLHILHRVIPVLLPGAKRDSLPALLVNSTPVRRPSMKRASGLTIPLRRNSPQPTWPIALPFSGETRSETRASGTFKGQRSNWWETCCLCLNPGGLLCS